MNKRINDRCSRAHQSLAAAQLQILKAAISEELHWQADGIRDAITQLDDAKRNLQAALTAVLRMEVA